MKYTIRLNNVGEFSLLPSQVNAMDAPEIYKDPEREDQLFLTQKTHHTVRLHRLRRVQPCAQAGFACGLGQRKKTECVCIAISEKNAA